MPEILDRLCRAAGIHATHADAFGNATAPGESTRRAILRDFGVPGDESEALAFFAARDAAVLPELLVIEADAPAQLPLRGIDEPEELDYQLTLESGEIRDGRGRALPPLPAGYHRIAIGQSTATILAAPARCYQPPSLDGGKRLWGVSTQVYGLRSAGSQGIGDFSDVAVLCERAAALGAAFAGLSPSHALFQANRNWISPYSPSSRLFFDPIYLDMTAIAGGTASRPPDAAMLQTLARAKLLDHRAIWAVKLPILEAMYDTARNTAPESLKTFIAREGEPLQRFATFEALFEHFAAQGKMWQVDWPAAYRDRAAPEVAAFAAAHQTRIGFHIWLQWLCDTQLAAASERAKAAGMAIGLYRDLAVGSDRGGAEVWSQPGAHAPTLSIGAPPDRLAPQGQNWGLPPLDPLALARTGLAAFRAPVVANMRHAGALRIDHAFQLARLFLVPHDAAPGDGAYVDYPFEAMLAVLRIESHRAKCAVIAEDLGTAPPGFSHRLMETGIFSCCVVPFERDHGGGFKAPRHYPRNALAMSATHDLPTFAGWWKGADIDLRDSLGIFDFVQSLGFHAGRRREIAEFAKALHREGLLDTDTPPVRPPIEAGTAFLARTHAALAVVQLEDAVGEVEQANLPGTVEGHPNWQRRLAQDMDGLFAEDGGLARLAAVCRREGR